MSKEFVLAIYPDAFAQENDGEWDININSQEGLVEGEASESEAWEAAKHEIEVSNLVNNVTLDAAWRYLNDREDDEEGEEPWENGGEGHLAKVAVVDASKLLDRVRTFLRDVSDNAGDVPEWNEGGEGYEIMQELNRFNEMRDKHAVE